MKPQESGSRHIFWKRYGLIVETVAIVIVLLVIKAAIDYSGMSTIAVNPLITAFLGGVFFTIGILFAGAASDYKEAEKIPGELAVSLKSLYKDCSIIPVQAKEKKAIDSLQEHIKELLYAINSNFRRNVWKLKELDVVFDKINDDIIILSKAGVTPNFLIKLRTELTNVDRLAHRVDIITETTFIPAAYTIAEVAIGTIITILLFVNTEPRYIGLIILGATSLVLISLLLLIKDMDNPYEVDKKTYADVDLSILFGLEEYWKSGKAR